MWLLEEREQPQTCRCEGDAFAVLVLKLEKMLLLNIREVAVPKI